MKATEAKLVHCCGCKGDFFAVMITCRYRTASVPSKWKRDKTKDANKDEMHIFELTIHKEDNAAGGHMDDQEPG